MSVDTSMGIPTTTQRDAAAEAAAAAGQSSTVDYSSFLKLLVTQMKNQDPTQPMESTDFMAQLATFSQVEQSVQMNAKLDEMMQISLLGQAGSLIGREVTSADGAVTGTVKEVKLVTGGMVAVLEGGDQVTMGAGVTIH